jgi:ankyrin repeat protein
MNLSWLCLLVAVALTPAENELRKAVQSGNAERVKMLLDAGVDVNSTYENRMTPIFFAEDPKIVDILLAHGARLDIRDSASIQTPIESAAEQHFEDEERRDTWRAIVEKLRDADAEYTIDTAIYMNDLTFVEAQLAKDDSWVNSRRGAQHVPLRIAARTGRVEICKLLLEHGADANAFEEGSGFPIVVDAVKYPAIVKLLIEHGADLKRRITWRRGRTGAWIIGDEATALHFAAGLGHPKTIELLIDHGVDIFARARRPFGEKQETALEVAAFCGRADNTIAILNHPKFREANEVRRKNLLDKCLVLGVDYNFLDRNANRSALVEALLTNGANANVRDQRGIPVAQIAARNTHPTAVEENKEIRKVVAILLQHGATLDLFSAVAIGDETAVERLLQQDPSSSSYRGPDGYPALHLAVDMDYGNIVRKLLRAGCDVDIRNRSENTGNLNGTPLHNAAFWGRLEIARLLIDAGADVNAQAERNVRPLDEAIRLNQPRLARLLLERGAKLDRQPPIRP